MPYSALSELPDPVKEMPKHAQEIYQKTFNSAWEQHKGEEGAEARCHAIARGAVKKSYKQVDGKWVAKESKEATMAKLATGLSDTSRRNLLQAALVAEYGLTIEEPKPRNLAIEEVFEDRIIYSIDGQFYEATYELGENDIPAFGDSKKVTSTRIYRAKAPYVIAEDHSVTFGDSVEGTRQVVYQPKEALQTVYSEIIQEVGKRNASKDAARVKKILEICQELLSSEEEQEKETTEALREAKSVLAWIKIQEAEKTEDGESYPSAAFAYVPDAEKTSTWKLRIWEDPEKKVTRAQLGRAAAALSPGGFRGQKVQIPDDDLGAVKRKIRSEYRKLGVEEDDIPRWVKEAQTRELVQNFVPLTEATFDKGRATVTIIKPGFNASKEKYYPAEILKRDYKIFEGQKMYADHPTEEEEKARPERSIKDWVATLSEVTVDESGVVTGIAEIVEPWLMQKLATLRDKQMLSEMGISINAVGAATKGNIEGTDTLVIERLVAMRSVDFVTEPGAGGLVTFYETDRSNDIDLVELSTLKEKRPDLVKAIEASVRFEITREVKTSMDDKTRITELEGEVSTLTGENESLKTAAQEAEKEKAKAEAQATIKEAVDKAELPDASKERLLERFKDSESADGIAEAIQAEVNYIAALSEAGKIRGLGASHTDPEADRKALKEAFRAANPDWTDEQLETAVTGR